MIWSTFNSPANPDDTDLNVAELVTVGCNNSIQKTILMRADKALHTILMLHFNTFNTLIVVLLLMLLCYMFTVADVKTLLSNWSYARMSWWRCVNLMSGQNKLAAFVVCVCVCVSERERECVQAHWVMFVYSCFCSTLEQCGMQWNLRTHASSDERIGGPGPGLRQRRSQSSERVGERQIERKREIGRQRERQR